MLDLTFEKLTFVINFLQKLKVKIKGKNILYKNTT